MKVSSLRIPLSPIPCLNSTQELYKKLVWKHAMTIVIYYVYTVHCQCFMNPIIKAVNNVRGSRIVYMYVRLTIAYTCIALCI